VLDEEPDIVDEPDARPLERAQGTSASITSASGTAICPMCSTTSISTCLPARPWHSSGTPGREVDDREAPCALLRPARRPGDRRRHGSPRRDPGVRAPTAGIVPQEGFLFGGSIADNIAFGRPTASRGEIEAAATAVGADAFIAELADGYDTQVGERGSGSPSDSASSSRSRAHCSPTRGS
jgi:hypothetical protein